MPWPLPTVRLIPAIPSVALVVANVMTNRPSPGNTMDPRLHSAVFWALMAFTIASSTSAISLFHLKGKQYSEAFENQRTCLLVGVAAGVATAAYLLRGEVLAAVLGG